MADLQPGEIIAPHGPEDPKAPNGGVPESERSTEQSPQEPVPAPIPAPEPEAPVAPEQTDGGWFHHEADPTVAIQPADLPADITWTASEFIAHEKSANWYAVLLVVAVAVPILTFLVTKDKFSTGVILLVIIMFGLIAGRKPRTQQYGLSNRGVQVGQKLYNFQDYKTFSVAQEGAVASVVFMPLKRFMPALTIYVAPDMEDKVVDFLAAFLPFAQHKDDLLDSLLRRIRF